MSLQDRVDEVIPRLRATRGVVFEDTADADVLRFAQVLDRDRAEERVTLAGLLALGRYPQQFFPQLDITFVVFPTTRPGVQMADGTRFLDNASLDGPIPLMIEQALAVVRRNMTRRAVIQGFGREDRWEYPEEVVRELLGNAVMHRDYHPLTHGSQIRLEMYPDRLAVSSPGGLYGNVRPDELMHVPASSSRNAALAKLLEDVTYPGSGKTVCENRGTGLLSVADMMRHAGLAEPTVTNRITQFTITLRNGAVPATAAPAVPRSNGTSAGRRRQLLDLLRGGPQTTAQLAAATGLQVVTIRHYLRELAQAGQVEPTEAKKRSRTNAWQIAATRRAV
jgi:ATP-dependent DNA helicase RecG